MGSTWWRGWLGSSWLLVWAGCVVGRRLRESGMAGLTGHYKGALRRLRKAPLERRSGHRRDALMCCCYWTIRVNLVVADALPEVAVTVTV